MVGRGGGAIAIVDAAIIFGKSKFGVFDTGESRIVGGVGEVVADGFFAFAENDLGKTYGNNPEEETGYDDGVN